MPSAISWEAIENAIQAAVAALSGIPGRRCIWTYQGGKNPGLPYIALQIDAVKGVGQPWKKREYNGMADELVIKVRQHQTALLTLQYFADAAGSPDTTGREPISALSDVMAGLDLYEYEIDDAGAGIGDTTPVQYVSPSGNGVLQARSIATVVLHLGAELERRENYVARYQLSVTPQTPVGDSLGTTTFWVPPAGSPDPVPSFSAGFSSGFEVH